MKFLIFFLFLKTFLFFRVYDAGYDNDIFKPKERYVRIGYESALRSYKNIYVKVKNDIDIVKNIKE